MNNKNIDDDKLLNRLSSDLILTTIFDCLFAGGVGFALSKKILYIILMCGVGFIIDSIITFVLIIEIIQIIDIKVEEYKSNHTKRNFL